MSESLLLVIKYIVDSCTPTDVCLRAPRAQYFRYVKVFNSFCPGVSSDRFQLWLPFIFCRVTDISQEKALSLLKEDVFSLVQDFFYFFFFLIVIYPTYYLAKTYVGSKTTKGCFTFLPGFNSHMLWGFLRTSVGVYLRS